MSWQSAIVQAVLWIDHAVLFYFVAINTQMLVLMLLGARATRRARALVHARDLRTWIQSPLVPPVSVIVTAYNESINVIESVRSVLQLRYPEFEVVVVNDGSTDDTLDHLVNHFHLIEVRRGFDDSVPCRPIGRIYETPEVPNLVVVDKRNGGKGDALNAGINVSRYPLFCAIDGDSVLEEDALIRVARPFLEHPETMIAAGGTVRVANGSKLRGGRLVKVGLSRSLLPRVQVVEYLRAFLFGRMGWSSFGGLLLISGAFGVFSKRAVVEVGGYATNSVGEDMELVIRMHRFFRDRRRPYHIGFVPEPVCWTEAPASLAVLRGQRVRWQRGLIDTLLRHRSMIGRPRYGAIGTVTMPAFLLFEMLSPIVEVFGYVAVCVSYALGLLAPSFMLAFLSAAILYAIIVSVLAVVLDDLSFRRYARLGELLSLASAAVVEAVALRPLMAWWRLGAFVHHLRGDSSWGHMERRGIAAA